MKTYCLPDFWLSPMFSGDYSSLTAQEAAQVKRFIADHGHPLDFDLAGRGFMRNHDAVEYGVSACECFDVVFNEG